MPANPKYSWYPIVKQDPEAFLKTRQTYHHIVQNVASVGRSYMESDPSEDIWADTLIWVPGLWRMAGKWILGSQTFRSSLSFKDFSIYLVDQKINPLGSFPIPGNSYSEVMIWLEEQIITQNLSGKNLSTELPYELPEYAADNKRIYLQEDAPLGEVLGGYFHDAFILLMAMKETALLSTDITIFPHHFDMEVKFILKKTDEMATNTFVRLGFSPGDDSHPEPYLYINSWPNLTKEPLPDPPPGSSWNTDHWIGLVLPFDSAVGTIDQHDFLLSFFQNGLNLFSTLLLD